LNKAFQSQTLQEKGVAAMTTEMTAMRLKRLGEPAGFSQLEAADTD
jgi:hypothetical protein